MVQRFCNRKTIKNAIMSIEIKPVNSRKELDQFINFNYWLYKGHPYAVPDLAFDLRDTFNKKKNPGLEFSEMQLFLALKDGKVAGRVVAIINHRSNKTWNVKNVRFGWIDFIEDIDVAKALLDTVEQWGKERGMTHCQGPMGITDMDKEGMLTEGFDRLGTMATLYNYPYYPEYLERLGYQKEAEWTELRMDVPEKIPEKYSKVGRIVMQREKVHIKKLDGRNDIFHRGYGQKIFNLINDAYSPLFGYSRMTERQIDQYIKMYLPLLDLRMVTLVETDDTHQLVSVGISMPSIVRALQKSRGKLLPFGWFHLLKSLKFKHEDGVELLLIAVHPDWQNRGINALLFTDLIPVYQQMGFKWAETNCILETNFKTQSQWQYLDAQIVKRRRCFKKEIS